MQHTSEPAPAPLPLLDEREAALAQGLTPRTLQLLRTRGGGPAFVRISSRCVRYRPRDLEDFAAERVRTSTADKDRERDAARIEATTPPADEATRSHRGRRARASANGSKRGR